VGPLPHAPTVTRLTLTRKGRFIKMLLLVVLSLLVASASAYTVFNKHEFVYIGPASKAPASVCKQQTPTADYSDPKYLDMCNAYGSQNADGSFNAYKYTLIPDSTIPSCTGYPGYVAYQNYTIANNDVPKSQQCTEKPMAIVDISSTPQPCDECYNVRRAVCGIDCWLLGDIMTSSWKDLMTTYCLEPSYVCITGNYNQLE